MPGQSHLEMASMDKKAQNCLSGTRSAQPRWRLNQAKHRLPDPPNAVGLLPQIGVLSRKNLYAIALRVVLVDVTNVEYDGINML